MATTGKRSRSRFTGRKSSNVSRASGRSFGRTMGSFAGSKHTIGGKKTKVTGTMTKTVAGVPTGYRSVCNNFLQKATSYRTLLAQTQGRATKNRPTPATLNSMARWVDKGAIIHKISAAQINRWAKTTMRNFTPTRVKNVLCARFGKNMIKAVANDKSGAFLVATPPNKNGKKFNFPR